MVSHADGTVIVYDKTRDDGVFTPTDPVPAFDSPVSSSYTGNSTRRSTSSREWDFRERMHVSYPPWHPAMLSSLSPGGKGEKEKVAKNPVSHWKVSNRSIVGK
jgi:catabolite repression protein CreC